MGRSIFFSRQVHSTNDWARVLARFGAPEGTVVVAEKQMKARGRLRRRWISPSGGLWFSLILRPELHPSDTAKLVFAAGLAVVTVLNETYELKAETKWPNDVLVNGKKICGILSEANLTGENVNFVVIGIGINANFDPKKAFPKSLKRTATSLQSELGRQIQLEKLFTRLLESLENVYELSKTEGLDSIMEKWKQYGSFLGCQVEVERQTDKLVGSAVDVDKDGALLLKLADGTVKRVFAGNVFLQVE